MAKKGKKNNTKGRRDLGNQKQQRSYFNGTKFNPSSDPPATVRSPWNSITIIGTSSSSTTTGSNVTVLNLFKALGEQLGVASFTARLRVQRIRAWLPTNGSAGVSGRAYGFTIVPYDFTTQVGILDVGDINGRLEYARVGYEWSLKDRNTVLINPSTIVHEYRNNETPSPTSLLMFYYDVLWQFDTLAAKKASENGNFGSYFSDYEGIGSSCVPLAILSPEQQNDSREEDSQ